MSYFLQAFLITLKQQLRSWRTWLMALLLPALILSVDVFLPKEEISAPVQVGVCLPSQGGEAFWEQLSRRSDTVVTFLLSDEDTVTEKVSTGQWDCGLILAEDFESQLEDLDTNKLITLYTSSASTVYPLVQETVSCVVMELISADIARDYAKDNNISGTYGHIDSLSDAQRVKISLQTLTGSPLQVQDLAQQTTSVLLRGCIALWMLIWVLFSAMDLGSWFCSAPVMRMTMVRSPVLLLLPRATASLTPVFLSALCGSAFLELSGLDLAALLCYMLTLTALALLLSRHPAVWSALPCLMPFIAALSLLLSPMIFDISALFPFLAPVCACLPMSLYLNACSGDWTALGILLLEGLILLLSVFCIPSKKHSKE